MVTLNGDSHHLADVVYTSWAVWWQSPEADACRPNQ